MPRIDGVKMKPGLTNVQMKDCSLNTGKPLTLRLLTITVLDFNTGLMSTMVVLPQTDIGKIS